MRPEEPVGAGAVGLDDEVCACLFDLDGVLTRTAKLHAEAWERTFDTFLAAHGTHTRRHYQPFDEQYDYETYLDGRPSGDGIRAFLGSRGIEVPDGDAEDVPGAETVHGIGVAKQWAFLKLLEEHGPRVHEGSVRYARAVHEAGLPAAVVTSSGNADAVLDAAGITGLFDATVDGRVAAALGLLSKPAPDDYLAAARGLQVEPAYAAVFEDSLAGVEAARAGAFGTIIGVDRLGGGHRKRLLAHGATRVVGDLVELLIRPGFE